MTRNAVTRNAVTRDAVSEFGFSESVTQNAGTRNAVTRNGRLICGDSGAEWGTGTASGVILGFLAAAAAHISACVFGEADEIAAARAALADLPAQ